MHSLSYPMSYSHHAHYCREFKPRTLFRMKNLSRRCAESTSGVQCTLLEWTRGSFTGYLVARVASNACTNVEPNVTGTRSHIVSAGATRLLRHVLFTTQIWKTCSTDKPKLKAFSTDSVVLYKRTVISTPSTSVVSLLEHFCASIFGRLSTFKKPKSVRDHKRIGNLFFTQ